MPSPESLRRLANLTREVRNDLRRGGMGVTFRYLFRANTILARVVEILADHVATEAEERAAAEGRATAEDDKLAAEVRRLERKAERLGR
jgi:histone H3/H4